MAKHIYHIKYIVYVYVYVYVALFSNPQPQQKAKNSNSHSVYATTAKKCTIKVMCRHVHRLFTVLYSSVRSPRSSALHYGQPSSMSVKTTLGEGAVREGA